MGPNRRGRAKGAVAPRATFRDVFGVAKFRAVWFSEILSVTGDRLALVALTLLVYDRTRSPLLAALAYASGYLPRVIGGLLLAGLADRRPRRTVIVVCVRAAVRFGAGRYHSQHLAGRTLDAGHVGDPDHLPGVPGARRDRRRGSGGLHRGASVTGCGRRHLRAFRLVNRARDPVSGPPRPARRRPGSPRGSG